MNLSELSYFELGIIFFLIYSAGAFFVFKTKKKQKKDETTFALSVEQNLHIPPTLHPVIDPKKCIGSLSCVKACPEGDIIGIVEGKAKLIVGSNCIGHSRCEMECPVGAINLVFGTSERGVDLPEVNEFYESSKPGIHIVGELGGMGLIKNASRQGIQVGQYLATVLDDRVSKKINPVLIVGAGPAGLATALTLRSKNIPFQIVTQTTLGGTIANYPRQKIVMTERVDLPIYGKFGKRLISKEELMHAYEKAVKKAKINIEEGVCVENIQGQDGDFTITTNRGPLHAQKVVLAIGRMGTPRQLGVPGENSTKVTYLLQDPLQYQDKNILVVGGGDSAMESAIMIAQETNARVHFACRSEKLQYGKVQNRENIMALINSGRVQAYMSSNVKRIEKNHVTLEVNGNSKTIDNDYLIINIGGVLPTGFLQTCGISIKRYHGEIRKPKTASKSIRKEQKTRNVFLWGLLGTGIAILAYLAFVGRNYYFLSTAEKVRSDLHHLLKPGGSWGRNIGMIATLVMLSNFLYAFRKNIRFFKGKNTIKNWLRFHVFVGLMSPLVILFHAAFQSRNLVATLCYISLLLVVSTGLIGRYFYGMLSFGEIELRAKIQDLQEALHLQIENINQPKVIHRILRDISIKRGSNIFSSLLWGMLVKIRVRIQVAKLKKAFLEKQAYKAFKANIIDLQKYQKQISTYKTISKIMSYWRVIHVVLALTLLIVIVIHIYTAYQMGYGITF
ncbi:MAG: NAD(P)-binding domain-containing protein [Deltaproteobacteria bacterium]|nr:NAD(P)-binding domain-containing protein [Deltaproteobacteria bacterium]